MTKSIRFSKGVDFLLVKVEKVGESCLGGVNQI